MTFDPVRRRPHPHRLVRILPALVLCVFSWPARAQGTLDEIRSRGELVIATDATYPPFEFMDGGRLRGFDVGLGDEIGRELGVRTRWLPMEWSGVVGALQTRKCDLVMSGVTITAERKKEHGFTRPYFLSAQGIAIRQGDDRIRKPEDLLGKTIGVQAETTGQYAVQKLGVPKSDIHGFDQLQDGLADVVNKRVDAAVADRPALQWLLRKSYSSLELVSTIGKPEYLGLEGRKEDRELLAAVNGALDRIMADGRYARAYEEWVQEPVGTALLADLDRAKREGSPVGQTDPRTLSAHPAAAGAAPAPREGFLRFDLLRQALPLLVRGAVTTLQITALTLLFGIPGGLLVALVRLSGLPLLRQVATVYVETVRGTPLLMQIYVIYFVLPALGISLPPFVAGVTALSLNAAAYVSEIFRAGIESIDSGQMEAARALGMDYAAAMRWVILPQTLRRVLPPLTNEAVSLLKDSSLVSVVALAELMRTGKEIATNNGSPTTIYLAVALLYLAMTLPLTYLVRRLEDQWQPISRPRAVKRKASAPQPA